MRYSPKPMSDYTKINSQGVKVGFGASELLAVPGAWNLFFLSEPQAGISERWEDPDTLPEFAETLWACHLTCRTFPDVVQAIETLRPAEFIVAVKKMNYKEMPIYRGFGEEWFEVMEQRALPPRGLVNQEDNVLSVNFMGHFLKLPEQNSSCIIMPMSYNRH